MYAPKGRDVVFTWEHRNKETQGTQAVDHFAVGIAPPDGLQYKIWFGYYKKSADGEWRKVELMTIYTSGTTWVLTKSQAEAFGEIAGRATESEGVVWAGMAINAVLNGRTNWQGYGISVALPSYPVIPGHKPGGSTDNPWHPDHGGGTPEPDPKPGTGGTPGTGGNPSVDPKPTDPTTPTDPDVPPTDPEVPVIPPTDTDLALWGNAFDHGWASEV